MLVAGQNGQPSVTSFPAVESFWYPTKRLTYAHIFRWGGDISSWLRTGFPAAWSFTSSERTAGGSCLGWAMEPSSSLAYQVLMMCEAVPTTNKRLTTLSQDHQDLAQILSISKEERLSEQMQSLRSLVRKAMKGPMTVVNVCALTSVGSRQKLIRQWYKRAATILQDDSCAMVPAETSVLWRRDSQKLIVAGDAH